MNESEIIDDNIFYSNSKDGKIGSSITHAIAKAVVS